MQTMLWSHPRHSCF